MWVTPMKYSGLDVKARISMQPAEMLPVVKPLRAGWGPTIRFGGKHYAGRVLECKEPIEPGESGEALIGLLAEDAERVGLREGSTFELLDGPRVIIATGTVLSCVNR